jgi:peptide deformylase
LRLFVVNPTGEPADARVYVNPELTNPAGEEEEEEGCLSLPEIRTDVLRIKSLRIKALDPRGRPFEEEATGFLARIWQHEFDHLNGTLIIDRMGPLARLKHRKALRELREQYEKDHPPPPPPENKPPKRPKRR